MIVSVKVARHVVDSVENVKNINNNLKARYTTESIIGYLEFLLNSHEAGFNANFVCGYGDFSAETVDPNDQCDNFINLIKSNDVEDVRLAIEVRGRADESENLDSCPGGFSDSCYSVPSSGTGDAGNRCNLYEPPFDVDSNKDEDVPEFLTGRDAESFQLRPVDYACSWNKLSFGSDLTDRVSVPLFYDDSQTPGTPNVVSPFSDLAGATPLADNFALRLRTPCRPCKYFSQEDIDSGRADDETSAPFRVCRFGEDEAVCSEDQRYELSPDLSEEILVQWQINGMCEDGNGGMQECGVLPYVEGDDVNGTASSVITGGRVTSYQSIDSLILRSQDSALNSITFERNYLLSGFPWPKALREMEEPMLNLFLTSSLSSVNNKGIPYLEYQVLTDWPVSSAKTKIFVSTNVDGNVFERTVYASERSGLIDFAVQN